MAKLGISTGTTPDDGTGTSLLIGAARINSNFDEIYDYFGTGTELSFAGGRWVETDVGINTIGSVGIGTTNPTYSLTVKGNTEITGLTSFANPTDATHRLEVAYYAQPTLRFLSGSAMAGTIEGQMGGLHLKSVATKAVEVNDNAAVFGSATNYYDVQLNKANNGSTKVGTNIQFLPSTGIVSATSFRGDGSLLTGISASGTGGKFVANATGIHTLSSVGIGTTTATGVVNTGNTSVLNVGVVTANNFYGTFRGDGTNITGIGVTNVKNDGGDVKLQSNASGVSITGIATATSFVGDGSGLTGIVGSGSGIVVKDSGSVVGTAGTINFADSLSVSAISGAAVTVSFDGDTNYWVENTTGIHTMGSVGIGTTTGSGDSGRLHLGNGLIVNSGVSTFSDVSHFKGNINIDNSKSVNIGDASNMVLTYAPGNNTNIIDADGASKLSIAAMELRVTSSGSPEKMHLRTQVNDSVELYNQNKKRLATSGVGVTIYGSGDEGVDAAIADTSFARVDINPGVGTFIAAVGTATTIDSFTIAENDFKSSEYQLSFQRGSSIQSQKILVMQDGTNAYSNEYAVMYNSGLQVAVGATVSGGFLRLEVTPQSGVTGLTTYTFNRTSIR